MEDRCLLPNMPALDCHVNEAGRSVVLNKPLRCTGGGGGHNGHLHSPPLGSCYPLSQEAISPTTVETSTLR